MILKCEKPTDIIKSRDVSDQTDEFVNFLAEGRKLIDVKGSVIWKSKVEGTASTKHNHEKASVQKEVCSVAESVGMGSQPPRGHHYLGPL